jgi:hypothetical protein
MNEYEPLKKAIKEGLRVVLLSVIPVLVYSLETNQLDYKVILVTAGIAALRFADKWMHEIGKELEENETVASPLTGGLTRF